MEAEFYNKQLLFLESEKDLRGISLDGIDITFPQRDNFKAIDFAYADFYSSKFRKGTFYSCNLPFMKIYGCEFHECLFGFSSFYAVSFEKVKFINCDFVEHSSFINCSMNETTFEHCYFPASPFSDSKFDETTYIDDPITVHNTPFQDEQFKPSHFADFFKSIKDAYEAGGVVDQERKYFFKERHASTRYNSKTSWDKMWGYAREWLAGYGVRPLNVLAAMLVAFVVPFLIFLTQFPLDESLLLTSGALFTFGAATDSLRQANLFYKLVYVVTAFSGLSLTALFITVLANVWFRQR